MNYTGNPLAEEVSNFVTDFVKDNLSEEIDNLEKILVSIKNSENHEDAIEAACDAIEKLDQISEVIFG